MKTFNELLILESIPLIKWAYDKTIEEFIEQCHRGDWILSLVDIVKIDFQKLTLAKGHCANTVRHLMKYDESINAVDVAIAFGEGRATFKDLNESVNNAEHALWMAAKDTGRANPLGATDAFYAVFSDYGYASYAAYTNSMGHKSKETADICREYIGDLIITEINKLLNSNEK
jgi:hypothetical protein